MTQDSPGLGMEAIRLGDQAIRNAPADLNTTDLKCLNALLFWE